MQSRTSKVRRTVKVFAPLADCDPLPSDLLTTSSLTSVSGAANLQHHLGHCSHGENPRMMDVCAVREPFEKDHIMLTVYLHPVPLGRFSGVVRRSVELNI